MLSPTIATRIELCGDAEDSRERGSAPEKNCQSPIMFCSLVTPRAPPSTLSQPTAPPKATMPAPEPALRPAFPPAADVTPLLRDPRYGAAFDRKYGKGSARKILGEGGRWLSMIL